MDSCKLCEMEFDCREKWRREVEEGKEMEERRKKRKYLEPNAIDARE